MPSSRLPIEFTCIGAQKAGTSWLNLNLKRHSKVFIPFVKETFFLNLIEKSPENYSVPFEMIRQWFVKDYRTKTERHITECYQHDIAGKPGIPHGIAIYMEYLFRALRYHWTGFGRDWYDHLYSIAQPGQVRGDITPDYSLLNDASLDALAKSNPDLRVILLMRDPVARDLSQLKMELLAESPNPSVDECIGFLKKVHVTFRSDYSSLIQRWRRRFGDNLLAEHYESIKKDPDGLIDRVCKFLGIERLQDRSQLRVVDNEGRKGWEPPSAVVEFLQKRYRA